MNKDELSVKSCEFAEIPKVQEEDETVLKTPYYWSWYRCIFSPGDNSAGEEKGIAAKE